MPERALKRKAKTCGTDAQCMRQTQHGLPRKSMEKPTGSREQNTIIASKEQKFMRDKCAMHETNTAWATKNVTLARCEEAPQRNANHAGQMRNA